MNNFNYWLIISPMMIIIICTVSFLSVRVSSSGRLENHLSNSLLNAMCSIAALIFFCLLSNESGRGIIQLTAYQEDGFGPSVVAAAFMAIGVSMMFFAISWMSAGFINMYRFEHLNRICNKVKKGVRAELMKEFDAEYGDYIKRLHDELGYKPENKGIAPLQQTDDDEPTPVELSRALDVKIVNAYAALSEAHTAALAEISARVNAVKEAGHIRVRQNIVALINKNLSEHELFVHRLIDAE